MPLRCHTYFFFISVAADYAALIFAAAATIFSITPRRCFCRFRDYAFSFSSSPPLRYFLFISRYVIRLAILLMLTNACQVAADIAAAVMPLLLDGCRCQRHYAMPLP